MFQTTRSKVGAMVLAAASLPSLAGCLSERDDSHGPRGHPDATIQSFTPLSGMGAEINALDAKAVEDFSRIKGEGPLHDEERLRRLKLYIEERGRLLEEENARFQTLKSDYGVRVRCSLDEVKERLQDLEGEVKEAEAKDSHKQPPNEVPTRKPPLLLEWIMDNGDLLDQFGSRPDVSSKSKSQHPEEGKR